ncbi:MAG: hypothetical protein HQ559_14230 [Lentisphaerae bacterium]|nr:hypothetical protein [Lentisphaerota bacterium]
MNARSWALCIGCSALATFAAGCASGGGGAGAAAPNKPMIDHAKAKVVAIKAITCMFLQADTAELAELVDPDCAVDNSGPGHGKDLIAGCERALARMHEQDGITAIGDAISVRRIEFFTKEDIPALKERFDGKRDLWSERQAPAYIEGALGCWVLAKELKDGKEVDTEVYVLVIKRMAEGYRIVFFGNS